ncbi:unnamed protein product [Spirodela intermedia]|uniref:Protein ENHANCED DISEASE RESISTANCE 2 C-terminal domain-containing protein n=1 Tax=Spirodela intermedia TaxID=51605 RepID=A0A7I8IHY1_SPIIN|nr:unnamed protein product [Spirodela intermedia]CAA6657108.1 unnamed protein product [Spirodela intermedia]
MGVSAGDKFKVRGPDYLSSRKKIPGGDYLLKSLGFDWIRSGSKIGEVLSHEHGRVRKALLDAELAGSVTKPFVWAFNLQLPSNVNYSLISYFVSTEPIAEGSLMDRFLKGDDEFRNSRLKMIANVVKGPWIVRAAVGEQAVSILGRATTCRYITGKNFIELDVDVGISMVGRATLTVDLAFLIEGQAESELPEEILGAVRFSELNPDSAGFFLELPSHEDETRNSQSSLSSRVWKSIGQGFSHLLHPSGQGHSSVPERVNGRVHEAEFSVREDGSPEEETRK